MTEQEMQFELMKSKEKVNELRQEVASMNKECEYWQQVRIDAAIAAMQAFIGVPQMPFGHIARESVKFADALIAELQKKQD